MENYKKNIRRSIFQKNIKFIFQRIKKKMINLYGSGGGGGHELIYVLRVWFCVGGGTVRGGREYKRTTVFVCCAF